MTKAFVVFVTASNKKEARTIAKTLVSEKLAACVSILPGLESTYRWQGRIEQSKEISLMIKTTSARYPALEKRIRSLHSYDVPEIVALPILTGNPAYLQWLHKSV